MDVLSELRQLIYKLRRDDVRSVQALIRKVIGYPGCRDDGYPPALLAAQISQRLGL